MAFGGRRAEAEVEIKMINQEPALPRWRSIYLKNKAYINVGKRRGTEFNSQSVVASILGAMVSDYIYRNIDPLLKEAAANVGESDENVDIFFEWASKINQKPVYSSANKIDFMVPKIFPAFVADKELEDACSVYIRNLTEEPFGVIVTKISEMLLNNKIVLNYEMFKDKYTPGREYPHNFVQWISHVDMRKRYCRLDSIDATLTINQMLLRSARYYLRM